MGCCTAKTLVKNPMDITNLADLPIITQSAGNFSASYNNIVVPTPARKSIKIKNPLDLTNRVFPVLENPNMQEILRDKTFQEIREISKCLSKHFLFNSLPPELFQSIVSEFKFVTLRASETVFQQNTRGLSFYIINSGKVQVLINNEKKRVMSKGELFGELALLHDTLRTATVMTLENSSFWQLSREVFLQGIKGISRTKMQENKQFIESISVFQVLTKDQKESLLNFLVVHDFNEGQRILEEGDPGNMMYIIKSGSVVCSQNGKEIRRLWAGDYFGEQALLYGTGRTASVISLTKTIVLSIGREDLVSALGAQLQFIIYKNTQRIALEQNSVLKLLLKSQVEALIEKLQIKLFNAGEIVIQKQPKNENLLIVLKGSVSNSKQQLGLYSVIGAEEIFSHQSENWEENWTAFEDCHVSVLSKTDLEVVLDGELDSVITKNEVLTVLKRVQLLRALPLSKLEKIAGALQIKNFVSGEVIFCQGDAGDSFYIVKEGQVEIFKDQLSIRIITRHDFFGERSIIRKENRTATVVSCGSSTCWILNHRDFLHLIDESILNLLKVRMELQNDKVQLSELVGVKLLGSGMFGQVFLVCCQSNSVLYALKTVSKAKIQSYAVHDNLVLERKIMLQVDHPFIIKLVKTFKDPLRVYYLLEYVQGIDLFDALRQMNLLNNESSKFYTACLMLILEHLHERQIVYRDLKPENIMVDESGYPKLIDFGTAKFLTARTYTIIGTPHYMAPEVIKGIGYSYSADFWSLGVMLYEFVCGCVPFGEEDSDPLKIYKKVIRGKFSYPNYIGSQRAKGLIDRLLDQSPGKRGNAGMLKECDWLIGTSWDALLGKQINPPFKPKTENFAVKVQKAANAKKSVLDMVASHEAGLEILKTGKALPVGWDDEF